MIKHLYINIYKNGELGRAHETLDAAKRAASGGLVQNAASKVLMLTLVEGALTKAEVLE